MDATTNSRADVLLGIRANQYQLLQHSSRSIYLKVLIRIQLKTDEQMNKQLAR